MASKVAVMRWFAVAATGIWWFVVLHGESLGQERESAGVSSSEAGRADAKGTESELRQQPDLPVATEDQRATLRPPACLPAGEPCLFSAERWAAELAWFDAVVQLAVRLLLPKSCVPDCDGRTERDDGCGGHCELCMCGPPVKGKCPPQTCQPNVEMRYSGLQGQLPQPLALEVKKTLWKRVHALRFCLNDSLWSVIPRPGIIRLDIRIGVNGKIAEVVPVVDSMKVQRLTDCLIGKLKGLKVAQAPDKTEYWIRGMQLTFEYRWPRQE